MIKPDFFYLLFAKLRILAQVVHALDRHGEVFSAENKAKGLLGTSALLGLPQHAGVFLHHLVNFAVLVGNVPLQAHYFGLGLADLCLHVSN